VPNAGGVKIGDFRQITRISKTVQDRRTVSVQVKHKVVCAILNGDIAVPALSCNVTLSAPNHMSYRIAAISITVSDLECH